MTHKSVKGWLWEQVISFPLKPLDGLEGVGKVIEHKANLQLQVWQHVVGQGRGWRKVAMVLPPAFSFRRRQTGREACWLLLDYILHPVVFASEPWWTSLSHGFQQGDLPLLSSWCTQGGFLELLQTRTAKRNLISQAGLGGLRMGVLACHLCCQNTISKRVNSCGCVHEAIFQLVTLAMKPDFQHLDVRIEEPVQRLHSVRCTFLPRDWVLNSWICTDDNSLGRKHCRQTCVSKSPSI